MKQEYLDTMRQKVEKTILIMKKRGEKYNNTLDPLDYYPKGWDICYTFLFENLNRLDSLMAYGCTKQQFESKTGNLLGYVLFSYVKMLQKFKHDAKQDYFETMRDKLERTIVLIISKDNECNASNLDATDYYPKGWNSCYTYLFENINRLDSLLTCGCSKKQFESKTGDLLGYVLFSYIKIMRDFRLGKAKIIKSTIS